MITIWTGFHMSGSGLEKLSGLSVGGEVRFAIFTGLILFPNYFNRATMNTKLQVIWNCLVYAQKWYSVSYGSTISKLILFCFVFLRKLQTGFQSGCITYTPTNPV